MANDSIATKETYIKMIQNSVGSKLFRCLYVKVENQKEPKDVLGNGELSCAVFVGSILALNGLISRPHATVGGVIKELEKLCFQKINLSKMEIGDIIIWDKNNDLDSDNMHIGFYAGKNSAISNSTKFKKIKKHHVTYGKENGKPVRNILAVYRPNFKD